MNFYELLGKSNLTKHIYYKKSKIYPHNFLVYTSKQNKKIIRSRGNDCKLCVLTVFRTAVSAHDQPADIEFDEFRFTFFSSFSPWPGKVIRFAFPEISVSNLDHELRSA